MRKLPAAAQEERRRQVIGLRERGLTDGAITAQVGLSRTGVFDICKRFAAEGAKGLVSQPRGRKPNDRQTLHLCRARLQGQAYARQRLNRRATGSMPDGTVSSVGYETRFSPGGCHVPSPGGWYVMKSLSLLGAPGCRSPLAWARRRVSRDHQTAGEPMG